MTALFGIAVAILTWDYALIAPITGLDSSWIIALNLGAAEGLDHGTELVFTYGPLGFLEQPLVLDGGLATVGAVYLVATGAALAASLLWAARRSLPWVPAAILALAAAAITPRAIVPLGLATVWCLVALQEPAPRWTRWLAVAGGGALAALELLVKLNVGVTILAVVVVTTIVLPGGRSRNLAGFAASFVVAGAVAWFASGQGIGNVDDYLRSSFETISGYSEAMQADDPRVGWDVGAAIAVAAASLAATAVATARLPSLARVGSLVIVAILVFALAKGAFVRHDGGHLAPLLGGLAAVWAALRWQGPARLVPGVAVGLIALAYFPATNEGADGPFDPGLAVDQLSTLVLPGERARARDDARAGMRAGYGLDPRIVERIGDAPVDVRPWEVGLAWAYELNWRPLPVIQDYQAYTPELDRLNAAALAADDGPRFVLRHFGFGGPTAGVDGRFTSFDSPRTTAALLCRFEQALAAGAYQLLERSADRCGEPRELETVTAAYGESVAVPEPDEGEAVFVRVEGATAGGIERLRTLAYRAAIRQLSLDGRWVRFAARNASGGLLLAVSPALDLPAPFALAPNASTIAIDSEGGFATSEGPLRFEFYAVPIAPNEPAR